MKTKVLFCMAIISAGICLYLFKPAPGGIYPPCPFYFITGLYCPGCGTLRGLHSLLHGDVVKALDLNPLMVLSIPFVIYLLLSNLNIKVRGRILVKRYAFSPVFYNILLVTIFSFWVLRNINTYPFTILAP